MKKTIGPTIVFSLLVAVIVGGCGTPIEINRFDPITKIPGTKSFTLDNEIYGSNENHQYRVAAALFEYNSVIVMPLEITNKTGRNIEPGQYSISLHDGRDLKTIRMLTRKELVAVKGKLEGNSSGSGLEGMALEATVNALMTAANMPTKNVMVQGLNHAINDYFSFRPIYAHETRRGLLCFLVEFKLEYPIALIVKIHGEEFKLKFMPRKTKT